MSTETTHQTSRTFPKINAAQASALMDEREWLNLHWATGHVVYADPVAGIGVYFGEADKDLSLLQMATMRAWEQQTPDWRQRVAAQLEANQQMGMPS